ncbi:NUDIX hydrolase superfamily protein [Alteracholeplasma palmae J233]|uniref:NUDIX hydrolase superfamily protein n=1 Tax=Alteracholeplasma palmae (strain ATCC 49389 / J233) TaxID=1318466 RepID=U4KQZ0_ALTPJ|nr:NUDIX domain-containing protein [Alteracholeplasma palmae]CCV63721.1 NUDIX hydrolase superfamily protein [Alteracholeplasma palmae J233]
MHNYIYTIAIIQYKDEILLQNRIKSPWNGMWNAIGGKKEKNESSLDCIVREINEETTLVIPKEMMIDKGIVTWGTEKDELRSGMHLYYTKLDDKNKIDIIKNNEGIYTWKRLEWILEKDNLGVAPNLKYILRNIYKNNKRYEYHCIFETKGLVDVIFKELGDNK